MTQYIDRKTKTGKKTLEYMKKICDTALDECLEKKATTIDDFAATVESLSEKERPRLQVDVNQNGLILSLPDYPNIGTTTGRFMMKHLGHDETEQSQFTTKGIENTLNSNSYDALEAELNMSTESESQESSSQTDSQKKLEEELGINDENYEDSEQPKEIKKGRRRIPIRTQDDSDSDSTEDDNDNKNIESDDRLDNEDENITPATGSQTTDNENQTQQDESDSQQNSDDSEDELSAAVQRQGAAIAQQGNEVDGLTLGGLTIQAGALAAQAGALAAHIGTEKAKELIESVQSSGDQSNSDAKKLNDIIERYQKANERAQQLTDRAEQLQQTSNGINDEELNIDDENLDPIESSEENQPETSVVTSERESTEEELTPHSDKEPINENDDTASSVASDNTKTENLDEDTDNLNFSSSHDETSTPTEKLAEAINKTSSKLEKTGLLEDNNDSETIQVDPNASISEQLSQIEKGLEQLEKRLDSLEKRISALEAAQKDRTSSRSSRSDEQTSDEQERQEKAAELAFIVGLKDSENQRLTDSQGRNLNFESLTDPETLSIEISGQDEEGDNDIVFSAEIHPEHGTLIYQNKLSSDDLDTMIEQAENFLEKSSSKLKSSEKTTQQKETSKFQQMEL